MKITLEQIRGLKPCQEGLDWYIEHGTEDLEETLLKVLTFKPDQAWWLCSRLMTTKQMCQLSIFAAESVLHIFEAKYPNDDRPRKAIEAAKAVIKKSTPETKSNAAAAAANADAAANAAYAAAYAADAAAAYAAAAYADAAYADAAARLKIQEELIKEAVRILEGEKK